MIKKHSAKYNAPWRIRNTRNISVHNRSNYNKPTANIKLNGEKFKAIPLKLGKRKVCPFSTSIQHSSRSSGNNNKTTKGYRGDQIGKKEVKIL